jgi:transcriptional regulator with XRE-family HTH domain
MANANVFVGRRLKQLRRSRGVDLTSLAKAIEVSEFYLAAIELGRIRMDSKLLVLACQYFGITLAEFMARE